MSAPSPWRIGIDLGGTKIAGVLLAPDGSERGSARLATPRDDYTATVDALAGLARRLAASADGPVTVGVGTPGTWVAARHVMRNCNSTWLNGRALRDDLRAALADLTDTLELANDANCFALSEAVDGAGAGAALVFGVILGTGVGGGLVVHGQVLAGANGLSGEWGHTPQPGLLPGSIARPCYCGRHNCIETWLSGPGLVRSWTQAGGMLLPAEDIVARALAGEALATYVLDDYINLLGTALAQLVNIIDPDVIVLGGGLSQVAQLYTRVPPVLRANTFTDAPDELATRLVAPTHGAASGVRGAAWLPRG